MEFRHLSLAAVAVLLLAAIGLPAPARAMGGGGMAPTFSGPSTPLYDADAEYRRGMADFKIGRYGQAAQDFHHVIEVQPERAEAWHMLGRAKSGAGDIKGAARAYKRSVDLDPDPIEPRRDLALAMARLSQKDKAIAQLDTLKARAAACADACAEAGDLKAAITAVEAAVAPTNSPS